MRWRMSGYLWLQYSERGAVPAFAVVLDLARTGLISTRSQERTQPVGWPKRAKQNRVLGTMCRHAGSWLGGAGQGEGSLGLGHRAVRVALWISLFVLYILYTSIIVVTVCFVCCSVELPLSHEFLPVFFLFSSPPQQGRGDRVTAWPFAGHGPKL